MRRVVLLGGGYVTLHAYHQLARRLSGQLRRDEVEIVIVSADASHSFHGFTGEVVAGVLPFERTRTPITEACPRARFEHARVLSVDPGRRSVAFERVDGSTASVTYDQLVVGTGGREPVHGVPGLAEHGFLLRGPGEIETLAARVVSFAAGHGETVVVAGGGLAGVELAAAIADSGHARPQPLTVHLVHSGSELLGELRSAQPRLGTRAEAELARLGVRVRLGVRLERVTPSGAALSDGSFLPARTVLGTIGQRPVALPGLESGLRDGRGRLVTASDLSVLPGVWAAGDAARVLHVTTGEPVASNALWAMKAGAHAGANAARALHGRETRPFTYRGLGQAASFGLGRGIAELYGMPFTGRLAWLLRLTFFLRFMPSRRRAALVVHDLVRVSVRGADRSVQQQSSPRLGDPRLELLRSPRPFVHEQHPVLGGVHAPYDVGDLAVGQV